MYFIVTAPTVSYGRCDDRYDHETGKPEKIRPYRTTDTKAPKIYYCRSLGLKNYKL